MYRAGSALPPGPPHQHRQPRLEPFAGVRAPRKTDRHVLILLALGRNLGDTQSVIETPAMLRAAVAISVAALCVSARAQTPGFWFVPAQAGEHLNHPAALSRDGSVLVGTVEYNSGTGDAFRWTRSGGREVYSDGPSFSMDAHGVSEGGTISAGVWSDSNVNFS